MQAYFCGIGGVFGKLVRDVNPVVLVPLSGLCVFGYWLVKTSLGRRALVEAKVRRNMMPPTFPWAVLMLWFCVTMVAAFMVDFLAGDSSEPGQVFAQTITQGIINATFGVGGLILARNYFARRLKGFGINFRNVPRDAAWAVAYLFAGWPVVIAALRMTLLVGKLIYGGDYQIEQHEELRLLHAHMEVSIRAAIVISGAIVTPFFEEVLFRGLIQSTIRSLVRGPWFAIAISSAVFAAVHPRVHWAGIFIMGMLLGYAYEKSGSLFRPMFIHVLFNGLTLIAAMS